MAIGVSVNSEIRGVILQIPIMNPLSTMLLVSAYRRRLTHLQCVRPRVGSMSSTSRFFTADPSVRAGATMVSTGVTTMRKIAVGDGPELF